MSAKKKRSRKNNKIVLFVAWVLVVLILIGAIALIARCSVRREPRVPAYVEFDTPGIVFGGGTEQGTVPDPPPSGALTLSADGIVFTPGAKEEETLTVSGENAEAVDWRVEWQDPASEWATGKRAEDYVVLDASAKSASVTLKAPFGERILVVCTENGHTAECVCDCAQVIVTFRMAFNKQYPESYQLGYGPNEKMTLSGNYIQTEDGMEEIVYSPYTLAQTSELIGSTVTLTQEFIASFRSFCGEKEASAEITSKLAGLDTQTSAPIVVESGRDHGSRMVYGGALPSLAFTFPLLTDGLSETAASELSYLLRDWLLQTEGQIPIVCNHIRFRGSVCGYVIEYESLFDIAGLERGDV